VRKSKNGLKGLMYCPHLRWQYTDADVVVVVFAVVAKAAFKPRKGNKLNFEY